MLLFVSACCVATNNIGVRGMEDDDHPVIIGIDLGNTYSRVGVYRNNGVEIIGDELGNRMIPSYVGYWDMETGQAVMGDTDNKEHTISDMKRLIGPGSNDEAVKVGRTLRPFELLKNSDGVYTRLSGGDDSKVRLWIGVHYSYPHSAIHIIQGVFP